MRKIIRVLSAAVPLFLFMKNADAQGVTISSPAQGTIYHPGDLVSVDVNAPDGVPVWFSVRARIPTPDNYKVNAPYHFEFMIPKDFGYAQPITIAASVLQPPLDAQDPTKNASVEIIIEPTLAPGSKLILTDDYVELDFPGASSSVVSAFLVTSDHKINVSMSPNLKIQSSDTSIVYPGEYTDLMGGGKSGTATVSVSYLGLTANVTAVNAYSGVRGDLNANGQVDTDDINILRAYIGKPAKAGDLRDLNGDGIIDVLDLRILTTLCTYPRCAHTP